MPGVQGKGTPGVLHHLHCVPHHHTVCLPGRGFTQVQKFPLIEKYIKVHIYVHLFIEDQMCSSRE